MLPEENCSSITLYMDEFGELYIDMNVEDYSDKSIDNFAKMIAHLGTMQLQLEAFQMATSGLSDTIPAKVHQFASKVTEITTRNLEKESSIIEKGQEDKPCIKPSDLL